MSRFLSWATDVLEAVDQSAATISQKDAHRSRQSSTPIDSSASDGHFSDGAAVPGGQLPLDAAPSGGSSGRSRSSTAASVPKGVLLSARHSHAATPDLGPMEAAPVYRMVAGSPKGLMQSGGAPRASPLDAHGSVQQADEDAIPNLEGLPTGKTSIVPSRVPLLSLTLPQPAASGDASALPQPETVAAASAAGVGSAAVRIDAVSTNPLGAEAPLLSAAKAPSSLLARMRAMRRAMDGRVWADEGLKGRFEEHVRLASEVEAKMSMLVAEMESLRDARVHAAAAHAREMESLEREQAAMRAAVGREAAALAVEKEEWEVRQSELQEGTTTCGRALEVLLRQAEEKAQEEADCLLSLQALEEELAQLQDSASESTLEHSAEGDEGSEEVEEGKVGGLQQQEVGVQRGGESQEEVEEEAVTAGAQLVCSRQLTAALGAESKADGIIGGTTGGLGCGDKGVEASAECRREDEAGEAEAPCDTLEHWERRVRLLEAELSRRLSQAQAASMQPPSAVQREKDVERRMRGLGEQLLVKQAQAEELANEVQALGMRLSRVQGQRGHIREEAEAGPVHEAGVRGRAGSRGARKKAGQMIGYGVGAESPSKAKDRQPRLGRQWVEAARRLFRALDSLAQGLGAVLLRSSSARLLVVAYVCLLHFVVLGILSLAASNRKLGGSSRANQVEVHHRWVHSS